MCNTIAAVATPRATVIVPVHNKRGYVGKCIRSVLSQSFRDFELLVIDDASSDGSWAEVEEIKDPRIRHLFRSESGPGGYAARNLGISESRGCWIAFLDADDEWLPGHLEKIDLAESRTPDVQLITAGWYSGTADGARVIDPYSKQFGSNGIHEITLASYLKGPSPVNADVGIVRSELVKSVGGFEEGWSHGADLQFWLKIFVNKEGAALWFPAPSAIYNQDAPNMVTAKRFHTKSASTVYIRELLARTRGDVCGTSRRDLKAYANRSALRPFLRKARQRGLTIGDVLSSFYLNAMRLDQRLVVLALPAMPHLVRVRFIEIALKKYL